MDIDVLTALGGEGSVYSIVEKQVSAALKPCEV
jgi:hypothetical protein